MKRSKKWWVQLIQQRPRPAHSKTWCILWRCWAESSTNSPLVNIQSGLSVKCGWHFHFIISPLLISYHGFKYCCFISLTLCWLLCVSQKWNGPVRGWNRAKWVWWEKQLLVSSTIITLFSRHLKIQMCEHWKETRWKCLQICPTTTNFGTL